MDKLGEIKCLIEETHFGPKPFENYISYLNIHVLHIFRIMEFHVAMMSLKLVLFVVRSTIGPAPVTPSSTSIMSSVVIGEILVRYFRYVAARQICICANAKLLLITNGEENTVNRYTCDHRN